MHHGVSTDLVHWTSHGIAVDARASPYGFQSPCSGFATVADGAPVVGFRQCPSTGQDGVPLSVRVANDSSMDFYSADVPLFKVYFRRLLPYDPVRPWQGLDGAWYATIALDSCNGTSPCTLGGSDEMWTAPAFYGPWRYVGPLFRSNRTALPGRGQVNEFVTPDYLGMLPGDPRGGLTRMFTNNFDGYVTYFLGTQADGQPLVLDQGDQAIGAIDWASVVPAAAGVGLAGLQLADRDVQVYSMARTLSTDPNQVTRPGRRVMLGWLQDNRLNAASMSLPRDLSLGPDGGLRQAFVPELQQQRMPPVPVARAAAAAGDVIARGLLLEIYACFNISSTAPPPAPFGLRVLGCADGIQHADILVDAPRQHAKIDRSTTDGDVRAGPLPALSGVGGGEMCVHAYVDHSLVTVIFNNVTAVTAYVHAPSDACDLVSVVGLDPDAGSDLVSLSVWPLQPANNFDP